VSNGISVPLTGWLMQRYGVVRTFVASVLLFTLASFLCGISWSLARWSRSVYCKARCPAR